MSSKKTIGCIGKCTTGLTIGELDEITDNVCKTLHHPEGRKMFKKFLILNELSCQIECLELYEQCSKTIEEQMKLLESNSKFPLESLVEDVGNVKEMAESLSGISQIDKNLLDRVNKALKNPEKDSLLNLLEEIRGRCRNHLSLVHKKFKDYASQPCPLNK